MSREDRNVELHKDYISGKVEALDQLLRLNKGLEKYFFFKYRFIAEETPGLDEEDIEQLCKIGLWRGIAEWEPEKGPLAQAVRWKTLREIRTYTAKIQSAKEDGFLVSETSFQKELVEGEASLEDIIKDPNADDPEEVAEDLGTVKLFFDKLEEKHQVDKEDLRHFKGVIYLDWPPTTGVVTRIKKTMFSNHMTRAFWENWMEENTSYYRSIDYSTTRVSHSNINKPTEDIAIKRIEQEQRLANLLRETMAI